MKILFSIIITLISLNSYSQSNYNNEMKNAFTLWEDHKTDAASNLFERIAKKEKENWLPHYYASLIQVVSCFESNNKEKTPQKLKKAQNHLTNAINIAPNNAEIIILQALHHTADFLQNPQEKAHRLAPIIVSLYEKALVIAPENPRVIASSAEWNMKSALYFKQDTSPFCDQLKKALLLFDTEKQIIPFGPKWGKDRVQNLLSNCNPK